jgi:hypothetical protein
VYISAQSRYRIVGGTIFKVKRFEEHIVRFLQQLFSQLLILDGKAPSAAKRESA